MIDFSKLKSLTIPEGVVKQITDASGRVLWSAVKNAKVTITSTFNGMDGDTARITVNSPSPFAPDPTNPSNKVTSWTVFVYDMPNYTIEIPVGSTVECAVSQDKANAGCYVSLNGTKVVTNEGTYIYTVTGNATIDVSDKYSQGEFGTITIVEEGYVLVTTQGYTYGLSGYGATAYIGDTTIGGNNNLKQEFVVPIGTVIKCTALYGRGVGGTITLNGTVVAKHQTTETNTVETVTYEYTVTGDADIVFAGGAAGPTGPNYGIITITEQ